MRRAGCSTMGNGIIYDKYIIKREATRQQYEKLDRLIADLQGLKSAVVAFSGGVDSTLLLKAAVIALGDKAAAVTLDAEFCPARETEEAAGICAKEGVQQTVLKVRMQDIERFAENPPDRCYYCKLHMFGLVKKYASEHGFENVIEGSNVDDLGDHRPGEKALKELGIISPLRNAGMTKEDIRALSRDLGLETWSKPSFACLASRFEYGMTITDEKLRMVEKAEDFLMSLGLRQVRVRVHGDMARLEVLPEDIEKMAEKETREKVTEYLTQLGVSYVALDLRGYRTGSMNETLK